MWVSANPKRTRKDKIEAIDVVFQPGARRIPVVRPSVEKRKERSKKGEKLWEGERGKRNTILNKEVHHWEWRGGGGREGSH